MGNEGKNLSERLRLALKTLDISQTELAKKINVKPQLIQYLCAGKAEKSKFTFDIAEALKIDVSWLAIGKGVPPRTVPLDKNEKNIPILTLDQIKEHEVYQKPIDLRKVTNWIPIKDGIATNSFSFILNDKSMAPRFDLNTVIIIDPSVEAYKNHQGNKFVLAYLMDEDFLVFRHLHIEDNDLKTLIPLNNSLYKNILLEEGDIILGICKEARWSI